MERAGNDATPPTGQAAMVQLLELMKTACDYSTLLETLANLPDGRAVIANFHRQTASVSHADVKPASSSAVRGTAAIAPPIPPHGAATNIRQPLPPMAYFGDAMYDRDGDPSSFTYKSDLYGVFKFVLLDHAVKEQGGQTDVRRLYQCEACLKLAQTHAYKDEQVYAIMTSGKRIVKYDPDIPRGITHLCVRHRRSLAQKPPTT